MENILLPTKIEFSESKEANVGKIVIGPCFQGYGTTFGNALRRVLLSSLPGAAVESVKIKNVQHEFASIDGVMEDVVQIILNLKQVAVVCHTDEPVMLSLSKKGKGDVLAGDFEKNADVEIVNPDLKIATLTDDIEFEMDITIGKGRGYVPVSEKETKNLDLGTIAIDSLYTPIKDIGYKVELTRVGDVTDYEELTITIETNGAITPKEALSKATKILMEHFALILEASEGESVISKKKEKQTKNKIELEEISEEVQEDPSSKENDEEKNY